MTCRMQICFLQNLRSLKLSDNRLTKLPKLLAAYLRLLTHLDVSNNDFRQDSSIPTWNANCHDVSSGS